ncbi:MAG TPA: Ig-like domain-containing protein [Anaerolineae bacterium]|nr:Ig-like domain-containing protein [Anaerolineae bacterium]
MEPPKQHWVLLMRVALVASLVLVAAGWLISTNTQPPSDFEYFSKTSHNVKGELLKFFREHGGLEVFGYPITEEFVMEGRVVQYFQRARMELHAENDAEHRVQLGLLGEELNAAQPPLDSTQIPPADDPDRRYFPETGHSVGFSFLRYFDSRGGVEIFGYPITEDFSENGRRVQYFQRARMEFNPDRPQGQQVQLADLGELHFDQARLDPSLRRPAPARISSLPEPGIARLRIDASLAKTYIAYPGQQTVHVYVTDDQNEGVPNAQVSFVVEYPGAPKSYAMQPTDANGYASTTFDLEAAPVAQQIPVRVTASFGPLTETTQSAFFIWR